MVIGSSWVNFERGNPSPFPTLSAQKDDWDKAEAVLKGYNLLFQRNRVDLGYVAQERIHPSKVYLVTYIQ